MIASMRFVLMATFIAVVSSGSSLSSEPTFEQAQAAFDAGDYNGADDIWRQLAAAGDVESMFALGVLLFEGPGDYPVNYTESAEWNLKASQLDHPQAQYNLGNAYQKGLGVVKDDEQAAYWWQRAAAQGMPNAAYNLGVQYMYGRGVPLDPDKALEQFKFAAARGHLTSRKLLLGWNFEIPEIMVDEVSAPGEPSPDVTTDTTAQTASVAPLETIPDQAGSEPVIQPLSEQEYQDAGTVVTSDSTGQMTGTAAVSALPDQAESGAETQTAPAPMKDADVLPVFAASESRILELPKDRYTLQITAMSKPELVDSFIRQYQLTGDMYRYRYLRDASTLYALSIGSFTSSEDAIVFRDQLTRNKYKLQTPWLRRIDDIQNLIRQMQISEH
jgi:TPR repeat protein